LQLTEHNIILPNNPLYKECDSLCFKSKNLYNRCISEINRAYKINNENIVFDLYHKIKNFKEYKELPAKVSCLIVKAVQNNYKSYFKTLSNYKTNPSKYNGYPKPPTLLKFEEGRYFIPYTKQALSKRIFYKTGKVKLSQCNIETKTSIKNWDQINQVQIIPKNGYYVIEVIYTIGDTELLLDNNKYLSIDLGLNNLATITSNIKEVIPIVINGRPLKSINQFYNKEKAKLSSELEICNRKKKSKKLNKLTLKRKNKIDNYLHKSSKEIVKHALKNNINTIIIGKNDNWKDNINIGKVNNQNFAIIPHSRFIWMIQYKCEKAGLNIIIREESYTSKASFIDNDFIPTYKPSKSNDSETFVSPDHQFSGKRIKRGLYKSSNGTLINADVNGSYNIMKKVIPNAFADGIEGVEVHPKVLNFNL